MCQRFMILIGLTLVTNIWLTTGEENNSSVVNTTSATEKVEKITEDNQQIAIVPENNEDNLIDRSSLHFHHGLHGHDRHHYHGPAYHGFWKKKFVWRPRWVKTWQEKKVYVAVWKRMWGPAMLNEWVPIPKPPPGWIKQNVDGLVIHEHPYHG